MDGSTGIADFSLRPCAARRASAVLAAAAQTF